MGTPAPEPQQLVLAPGVRIVQSKGQVDRNNIGNRENINSNRNAAGAQRNPSKTMFDFEQNSSLPGIRSDARQGNSQAATARLSSQRSSIKVMPSALASAGAAVSREQLSQAKPSSKPSGSNAYAGYAYNIPNSPTSATRNTQPVHLSRNSSSSSASSQSSIYTSTALQNKPRTRRPGIGELQKLAN